MTNQSKKPLRAMAFFDVQNLFRHAKSAFKHNHPNFDPLKLHKAVCTERGWNCGQVRFYTGVPDRVNMPDTDINRMWAGYWEKRSIALKRAGVNVTTRKLRYRGDIVQEKGIDVRLALDLVKFARKRQFDVAVLFSQDQDLAEVVSEVKEIAEEQGRVIKICCAFPAGTFATTSRGVDKTDWFKMNETFYNACLDLRDYRPRR